MAAVKEALFRGHKIEAIKLYREGVADCGLAEAKTAVEKMETELRSTAPEKFTAPVSGGGCLKVVTVVCLAIGIVIFLAVKN